MTFIAFKGATSYELQIGVFWIKFCFLMGGHWKWHTFFSRFKLGIDKEIAK